MGRDDAVARAIRDARMARDWSMRDVEALTTQMAELTPDQYQMFSRTACSHLENEGIEWLSSTTNYRSLRAVIHLLFTTDARFTALTGTPPPYGVGGPLSLTRDIPVFREGDNATREELITGTNCVANTSSLSPQADFALLITRDRMLPFVAAGQEVQVVLNHQAAPGDMVVFNRKDALEVAWCVAPQELAFARGQGSFKLTSATEVLGTVISHRPFLAVPAAKAAAKP